MAQAENTIPAKMQAAVYTEYGNIVEKLSVQEMDVPEPAEGQVLVKVAAASANPFDYKLASDLSAFGMGVQFPKITGYDFSGTVAKLGPGVDSVAVGDAVYGMVPAMQASGTMAGYTVTTVDRLAPKPANMSFIEAGAAPCVAATSYQVFTRASTIVSGESNVLILGGSSSAGMFGIQIAKKLGAAMVATTSTQEELCKGLGADVVVNYREADFTEVLAETKFDIVYDCVGADGTVEKVQAVTKAGSVFVSIASQNFPSGLEYPECKFHFMAQQNAMQELSPMFDDGSLKVVIDERSPYRLENVQQLFGDLMAHSAHGKLVVSFE